MSTSTRLIAALLLAGLALSAAASAWELRLTNNTADQQLPAISGTKVVWQDNQNGNWDIYLYDALTGETRRLTDNPKDQMKPQIAGKYVVWEDYRNSVNRENPDIYKVDLETGDEGIVHPPLSFFGGYECDPAISEIRVEGEVVGWVVIWVERNLGMSEQGRVFYWYIGSTSAPEQVYQDSNVQKSPWIWEQRAVWTDAEIGGVYFRNLLDEDTYPLELMPNSSTIKGLRAEGDRIVWSQYIPESMTWNIRVCKLDLTMTNGTKSWLSPYESLQEDPAIDDRFIVWKDDRNGVDDLYLYDLQAQQVRPLVTAGGSQREPSIDGGLVAFTDSRNDNNEIYLVPASDAIPLPGVTTVPGGSSAPRDPDGDGRCEDVNGNGRKDFADVVLYFNQMGWIAANEPTFRFDYNANGRIDFADVVWLFNHL